MKYTYLLTTDNVFHAGWLAGVLSEPRNADHIIKEEERINWLEGYDMAIETKFAFSRTIALIKASNQIKIWRE